MYYRIQKHMIPKIIKWVKELNYETIDYWHDKYTYGFIQFKQDDITIATCQKGSPRYYKSIDAPYIRTKKDLLVALVTYKLIGAS